MKTKAVDEMMKRIKQGIVLRPIKKIEVQKVSSEKLLTFVCLSVHIHHWWTYKRTTYTVTEDKLMTQICLFSQDDDSSWKVCHPRTRLLPLCCDYKAALTLFKHISCLFFSQDQKSDNRKSAILELKGMLVIKNSRTQYHLFKSLCLRHF